MVTKIDNSQEARLDRHLSRISDALASISRNIGHEMGPMKAREVMTMVEQMQPEWDKQAEANRREEEILELKRSNKIAIITARIAVFGLVASMVFGLSQLVFSVWQHNDLKQNPTEKIIVVQEMVPVVNDSGVSVSSESAEVSN